MASGPFYEMMARHHEQENPDLAARLRAPHGEVRRTRRQMARAGLKGRKGARSVSWDKAYAEACARRTPIRVGGATMHPVGDRLRDFDALQIDLGEQASASLGLDRNDCVDAMFWLLQVPSGTDRPSSPADRVGVLSAVARWVFDTTDARKRVYAWNRKVAPDKDVGETLTPWL